MSRTRLAVIYYSTYGTNHQMAETAAEAAREAGAEVRLRKVRETAPEEAVNAQEAWSSHLASTEDIDTASLDDLEWADAYLFSAPTRSGGAASQMRAFIDTVGPLWTEGTLANKVVSAMTSARNPHGGQETTLLTMNSTFRRWGAILVPPGYGVSVSAGDDGVTEASKEAIRHQVRGMIRVSDQLRAGKTPKGRPANERAMERTERSGALETT